MRSKNGEFAEAISLIVVFITLAIGVFIFTILGPSTTEANQAAATQLFKETEFEDMLSTLMQLPVGQKTMGEALVESYYAKDYTLITPLIREHFNQKQLETKQYWMVVVRDGEKTVYSVTKDSEANGFLKQAAQNTIVAKTHLPLLHREGALTVLVYLPYAV